ncbi:hypothetical protein KKE03_02335 [Patescibacteria group bacterium]|nr:hypothetical protein [Patescibacteria group bacterium]
MNQGDFKKLLDESLEPIKETLDEHGQILNKHSQRLETLQSSLKTVQSSVVTMENTLETVQSSVATIENTINAYGDMYKINNSNAKKLEKRIEPLEENAGITPPPEYTLAEVQ